jgi:hypothetical protein
VRRRIAQKREFIADDAAGAAPTRRSCSLARRPCRCLPYRARYSLTQVFFDVARHGASSTPMWRRRFVARGGPASGGRSTLAAADARAGFGVAGAAGVRQGVRRGAEAAAVGILAGAAALRLRRAPGSTERGRGGASRDARRVARRRRARLRAGAHPGAERGALSRSAGALRRAERPGAGAAP